METRQESCNGICGKLLKDTDTVRVLAISRSLGMTVAEYLSKVSHEEHLLRVAELAIDPYRDVAKILGTLVSVSAKLDKEYPYTDNQLIKEYKYQEMKNVTSLQDSERSLLYAFVGKEEADRVLAQIRERETNNV